MLYLVFQLGPERFALAVTEVVEVLPLLQARPLPQAPPGVAGLFDYHGTLVPLLDLSALALGEPAPPRMSTRIMLVRFPDRDREPLLGLLAERATETLRREPADFAETGVTVAGTPYLGPVTRDARGLIQRVELSRLLPEAVREVLFRGEAMSA